jgi:hypothetical protein
MVGAWKLKYNFLFHQNNIYRHFPYICTGKRRSKYIINNEVEIMVRNVIQVFTICIKI